MTLLKVALQRDGPLVLQLTAVDKEGATAMHYACMYGSGRLVSNLAQISRHLSVAPAPAAIATLPISPNFAPRVSAPLWWVD